MGRMIRADYKQLLLLPPCVDDWIPADHSARFIRDFVDALDMEELGFGMPSGHEGRPAYSPDLLLKVWLYGYFTKTRSTRKLERACYDSMAMIWLTGNNPPDHNTLWRFWSNNKNAFRKIFKKSVQVAVASDFVNLALQAVDGTKISAQVSTAKAMHRKELEKQLSKLDEAVSQIMSEVENAEENESGRCRMPAELANTQKRRKRIQESLEALKESGVSHQHRSEPEAKIMKCREGKRLAYNAQTVVESDNHIIVAADVTDEATDHGQLSQMVEQSSQNTGQTAQETLADSGYYSAEQLAKAEAINAEALVSIPDKKSDKAEQFQKSNFRYDKTNDTYTCPQGKKLQYERTRKADKKHLRRVYRCKEKNCPHRQMCTNDRKGRSIERSQYEEAVERQKLKQADPAKRALLKKRKQIAELPFARLKHLNGFRRWTVRNLENVKAQWSLLCATLNLQTLYRFWKDKRLKSDVLEQAGI